MGKTNPAKYGELLADWINVQIISSLHEFQKDTYKSRLIEELKKYQITTENSTPDEDGTNTELNDPEQLARTIKKEIYSLHKKKGADKALKSLLDNLQ